MAASFNIRSFERDDIAACASALAPTYAEPPYNGALSVDAAQALIARAVEREPHGCWLAIADSKIIGALLACSNSTDGSDLTISELFVVPAWRRRGVARALIAQLRQQWPSARKIGLLVDRRAPAHEVYKRLGFVEQETLVPMLWVAGE